MKKISSLIAILLLCTVSLFAQAPEKFTYQAVVRNASNALVANAQVGVRVSILQGSTSGSTIYVEVHSATTNANGLVTVIIGDGTVQQGTFSEIDWANGPFFLKTETDPDGGTNYNVTSTQQLLSVPYALFAKEAGNVPTVPTNVSAFTNDAGYVTAQEIPTIPTVPTNVSAFTNDAGYITAGQVPAQVNADWNATSGAAQILNKPTLFSGNYNDLTNKPVLFSGNYNDLTNKPTIPTVPTNVSAFTNDAGYITATQVPAQVNADWNATSGAAQILNKPVLFSGNYNDLTNKPTLFSGNYNDLTNKPTIPTVPTNVSAFNNDAGYITSAAIPAIPTVPTNVSAFTNDAGYLTSYTETDPLFTAWDKNYNDLTNKPTIPTVPTNVSAFTNDAGYITFYTETDPLFIAWDKNYNDLTNKPNIPTVPTNVSAFTNDAGYVTAAEVQQAAGVPTVVSAFQNDAGYITAAQVPAQENADWNATTGAAQILNKPTLFSGNYNDLTNKPTIPTVPTDVSAFNNDAGYITGYTETDPQFNAWDKDYNDLINKPTIPTIPTNVSAFTNDAGYITGYTETDPQFNAWNKDYNDLINKPTIPTIPTNVSAFTNDAGYLTSYTEQQVLSISNDTIFLTGGSFVKLPEGFSGSWNDLTDKPENISVPDSVSAFVNDVGYITQDQLNTLHGSFNSLIDSLSNEIYTLRMMMDTTLYTVTVVANNNSMGSVLGGGSFHWGATDTLIAVPDSGYQLKYWVSNFGDTLTTNTCVITVKQNVIWTAYFDYELKIQYRFYGLGSGDTSWHNAYDTFEELKQDATVNSTVYGSYKLWENYSSRESASLDLHIPVYRNTDLEIYAQIDTKGKSVEVYRYGTGGWAKDPQGFNNTEWWTHKGGNIYEYYVNNMDFTDTIALKYSDQ